MNKILVLTTCILALSACSAPESTSTDTKTVASTELKSENPNEAIDAWFEKNFMEGVSHYPQFLTQLGSKQDYDKWNDPSDTFFKERIEGTKADLKYIKKHFDPKALDESHALSYRLYVESSQDDIDRAKWRGYGYSFNQMFGAQSGIPSFLINNHRISSIEDANAYIARINGVKGYLGQQVANSKASAARGIMPPLYVYEHVIRDSGNVIVGAPFDDGDDSTLFADFKKKIDTLEVPAADKMALIEKAATALTNSFKPAYEGLIAEMKAQQAIATTDDGVWKLPKGAAYYKSRLKQMTTTDMTATEIHNLGLSEVDRIHSEMRAIMTQVGFEGSLQEFFTHLKTDPKFVYEDSDAGREAYIKRAEEIIETMKARLDDVFMVKPKADLTVKKVEAFREKSAGKAFYNRPAPDGSRPGIYYANLYKITDMPKYQMEALAYHEGIPGHHMQIAIQQELENIPKFRKFSGVTAYSEGWGLYSEFLPKEMGFYQDPYSDFGRLAMELWRAARLVVDTGLHDKQWTREQAIEYLTTNTPNPENDCIKAIERYIVMPGQATAYKIGMLKILSLREDAKKRLADKFDIREYHNVIIASGPVPLNIMEERVEAWVKSKS